MECQVVAWMMCEEEGLQDGNGCRPCGNGCRPCGNGCRPCGNGCLRISDCLLRDHNREVEEAQEYSLELTPAYAGENFRQVPEIEGQL
jgi:hypothetical protein